MLTIIEIEAREDGGHGIQSQSHREECWLEGWVAVPEELNEKVWACGGFCDLTLNEEGELVDVTPKERPELETIEEEPTQLDRVEAQVTYTAMMTDTLLEE